MSQPRHLIARLLYSDSSIDGAVLFLRIAIGTMLITSAITKSQDYPFLASSFPDLFGLGEGGTVTAIAIAELVTACLLVAGLLVRPAALLVACGMFAATFVLFPDKSFAQGELSLVYCCIAVTLLISGAGRYSLDSFYFRQSAG